MDEDSAEHKQKIGTRNILILMKPYKASLLFHTSNYIAICSKFSFQALTFHLHKSKKREEMGGKPQIRSKTKAETCRAIVITIEIEVTRK